MGMFLFVALLGGIAASAWYETVWIALAVGVVYLAVSFITGGAGAALIMANLGMIPVVVGASIAIGALWSLWKWRRRMVSDGMQKMLRTAKDDYDKKPRTNPFKESEYFPKSAKASENIDRIITWIMLWPFSMLIYFFDDFLRDIGRWAYNRLGKVYVHITDSALPDDMK